MVFARTSLVAVAAAVVVLAAAALAGSVTITADLTAAGTPVNRGWEGSVGSSHASTTLRADWQAALRSAATDLGVQRVRFHGILDDDMSVVLPDGSYSFFDADQSFDYLLSQGVRPIVELSFMPALLASGNETIFHYNGNTTPPRDYDQWAALISAFVGHLVDRYGIGEVSTWWIEVWNEPNLSFWSGTQAEYFELFNRTSAAIKGVDARLRVGGPATAQTGWIQPFLEYALGNGVAVDFVSTHLYPTDPNVPQNYSTAFSDVVAAAAAQAASAGLPLILTEYNAGLGINVLDYSYAAAFVAKQAEYLQAVPNLAAWSYWCLSDIFEEGGQMPQPFSQAFGIQTVHGVKKPVYRAFQLMHQFAGDEIVPDQQVPPADASTVDAWTTRGGGAGSLRYATFVTNFAIVGLPQPEAQSVVLQYTLPAGTVPPATVTVFSIDNDHTNPRAAWEALGQPEYPTPLQIATIAAAAETFQSDVPTGPGTAGSSSFSVQLQVESQSLNVVVFNEYIPAKGASVM